MAYKPYKMKGHSLPGPNQRKSPAKQTYDKHGTDERAYKIDQDKYDNWRHESQSNAPDIRYVGQKEHNKHLENYLNRGPKKASLKEGTTIKNEGAPVKGPQITTTVIKSSKKKSPAKCPLVAALAPAVIGAISKKKEQ